MRLIRRWLLASLVLGCAAPALAQTVDPRIAEFDPSPDHSASENGVAIVSGYQLEIYQVGGTVPVRVLTLGKPSPDTDGVIRVVFDVLLNPPLAAGVTYEARAVAVGPGGVGRSTPSNTFLFQTGTCSYTVTPTTRPVPVGGGNSTFSVATTAGCTWTAVSQAGWITVTSGANGTGNGTVGFTAAPNTGAARSSTILIAGQTVSVTQPAATTCSYSVTPTTRSVPVGGGNSTFSVATGASCTWTAASQNGWITVTSGASGTGNGTVSFTAAANTGPARSGTLLIAGQQRTVTQASGGTCTFVVSPLTPTIARAGGAVTITVTTQSGCTWSAAESPNVSWVSITNGSARTGTGTFTLQVLANAQPSARTMRVTVAGSLVTLTQNGNALTMPSGLRVIR
jgi:uncharacterized protein (UPF0548 family)